jgi:cysteinyl-tRNA synthetase
VSTELPALRLYNTLSRTVEDFSPIEPGHIRIYVCGMTVYDRAHIGHARYMVVFDAFVRYLRHRGYRVTYATNYTDIDDKIIRRSTETGEDPMALAERNIREFEEDAVLMGLLKPDHAPRVSEHIDSIQALITSLIERGHAYVAEGSVWFDVPSDPTYGCLSGQKPDEMRSEDAVAGKRSPADFALWKAIKPGEPSWPSPWGDGRPGWHIECSAMSAAVLGTHFDIHGGGLDLVFPHHENEIAQSVCGNASPYANVWMHNGLLTMPGGKKMGKSLGNVINLDEAMRAFPAEAIRLYLLQNHYRSPIQWGPDALSKALAMLSRLYEARELAEAMGGTQDADEVASALGEDAQTVLELGRTFTQRAHAALDDDFKNALVLGHAFELARALNRLSAHKKAKKRGGPVVAPALAAFGLLARTLGLMQRSTEDFHEEVKTKRLAARGVERSDVLGLLEQRAAARQSKDWARADAIRDELAALGVVVRDTPAGVVWRLRLEDS